MCRRPGALLHPHLVQDLHVGELPGPVHRLDGEIGLVGVAALVDVPPVAHGGRGVTPATRQA